MAEDAPVGHPRSLLPRPKPCCTQPSSRIGYGSWGCSGPTMVGLLVRNELGVVDEDANKDWPILGWGRGGRKGCAGRRLILSDTPTHGDDIHRLRSLWHISGTLSHLSNSPGSAYGGRYSPPTLCPARLPPLRPPASKASQSTPRPSHRPRHPHHIPTDRVQPGPEVDRVPAQGCTV